MSLHPEPAHTASERCDSNSAKTKTNEETKTIKKEIHFPKEEVNQEIDLTEDTRDREKKFRQECLNLIQKIKGGTLGLVKIQDDCMEPATIHMRASMEILDVPDDNMMARGPIGCRYGGKGLMGPLRYYLAEAKRRENVAHMQEEKGGVRNGPENQSKSKPKLKVEEGKAVTVTEEGKAVTATEEGNEGKDNSKDGELETERKEGDENSGLETPKNGEIGQDGQNRKKSKAFIPFIPQDTLLLVGEGDFSFAVSVLKNGYIQPQNLVATSYDSEMQVLSKYSTAGKNLKYLKSVGVKVLHEIDATKLSSSLKVHEVKLLPTRLNRIMFNFPHTGRGIKDANRNIRDHQNLVQGYFQSAKNLLQTFNGKMADTTEYFDEEFSESILLSVFESEPYISWGIKALARNVGYKVEKSGILEWEAYSGYSHRRTDGMGSTIRPASDRIARTYVFTKYVPQEETKAKAVHSDNV